MPRDLYAAYPSRPTGTETREATTFKKNQNAKLIFIVQTNASVTKIFLFIYFIYTVEFSIEHNNADHF